MSTQPTSILIAALGGEGGGTLAQWIVQAAQTHGLAVQGTSVPGVAQRTGATSYYIEFWSTPVPEGSQPVFALMPVPGRVDVVLASELLEATRVVERGFADPQRTLLITAQHRVLTTLEKMAMGDGRLDDQRLLATVRSLSRQCLVMDLQGMAQRHRTIISAVMFGALAGSGALPWPRQICEDVVRAGGLGVEASLAGFSEAFAAAAAGSAMAPASPAAPLSPALADVVERGESRLRDYQDEAYVQRYRTRVEALRLAAGPSAVAALEEAARELALWMSYEDVIRVADLKTRRERFERVRAEAGAGPDDVLEIREHLTPGWDEVAAIAPRSLGLALRRRFQRSHAVGARGKGMTLATTSIHGFALLRLLAWLRHWRPMSLRFHEEQQAIDAWVEAMRRVLPLHAGFAAALARLPSLRKGYSDTFERGCKNYERIFASFVTPIQTPDDAAASALQNAVKAAMADPDHVVLDRMIGSAKGQPEVQPVRWQTRDSTRTIRTVVER